MPQPETQYDVLVIGAGAGGLSAAARLVAAGRKVLLVESLDHVGGRAASETIEGFTVNIGAIALGGVALGVVSGGALVWVLRSRPAAI